MTTVDQIVNLFEHQGQAAYLGEPVSQEEHALQAADLAVRGGAADTLIAAALLHDIGHLLHGLGEDIADRGIDAHHETAGQQFLSRHFGDAVSEPVRLHVMAKRYLCASDAAYLAHLSPASVQSLGLQGGPLTQDEATQFESNPFYREAVRLRRWDDQAKIPGLTVPPVEHYRALLEKLCV